MKEIILGTRRQTFISNLVSWMNQLPKDTPLYEKARKTFSFLCLEEKKKVERRVYEAKWLAEVKEKLSILS